MDSYLADIADQQELRRLARQDGGWTTDEAQRLVDAQMVESEDLRGYRDESGHMVWDMA